MAKIKSIHAREILDSRGNPTIEAEVILGDGAFGRAAVPSGASTGSHEAIELRDGGERYGGKGVRKAVDHVENIIALEISGRAYDQKSLDKKLLELDGTENKSRLGANAILSVSLAFAHAAAKEENVPLWKYVQKIAGVPKPALPRLMMNILNGGQHAAGSTDLQEFMVVPKDTRTREALRIGAEVYQALKSIIKAKKYSTLVGDEGGFAPAIPSNKEALSLIVEAIERAGYKPGQDVAIAIDAAASEFYENGSYVLEREGKTLSALELINLYASWIDSFPIISIEDGLSEDDWEGFAQFTKVLGKKIMIVGDDLFVTNSRRLAQGIREKSANAILLKPNQIGTATETIEVANLARQNDFGAIMSHRSGETEDSTISHLAVGLATGWIKTGAPARGERTAKYNELIRIEETLG